MIVPMGYRPSLCRRYRLVGAAFAQSATRYLVIAKDMLDETTKDSNGSQ